MEKNLGHATAYGYAKSKGYSGTEDEFAQLMADYASVGQSAAQSAEQAAASATGASGSAASAAQDAQTATDKASEAVTAADTATTKASEANTSAQSASQSATSASTSAQTATAKAGTATAKADEAAASEAAALSAKVDAETARDAAVQSASEAAASAASIDPATLEHRAYGAYVVESATGAVASFSDGADNIPMKDVLVHVDPVQDLHGYDFPWPAGGGVNKLLPRTSDISGTTSYGITFSYSVETETLTMSGTNSDNSTHIFFSIASSYFIAPEDLKVGDSFWFAGIVPTEAYVQIVYRRKDTGVSTILKYIAGTGQFQAVSGVIPDNFDGIVRIDVGVKASETISGTAKLMLSLENSAPTEWTPYSNICPISGWTGAKVTRHGKNLCESLFSDGKVPSISNGALVNTNKACRSDYIPVNGGSVTFSCKNTSSRTTYCFLYGENKDFLLYGNSSRNSITATHADAKYAMICCDGGTTAPDEAMLELGSTATDYESYSGQTYDITFPAEAGTVYGGTLDVTSGELVVDRAFKVFNGSENWEFSPTSFRPNIKITDIAYKGAVICNMYPYSPASAAIEGTIGTNGGDGYNIWIKDSINGDSLANWKTFLATNNLQVVYELVTPITYTLTQQEITSLLGTNNLWADTGDSEVEYRADTKMYVDNKITQAIAAALNS